MFVRSEPHSHEELVVQITADLCTESTRRLCMRRKKRSRQTPETCEASFLRKRRKAVATAAEGSTCTTPTWMKGLSAKLWTGKHAQEKKFNRKKYEKKKVLAFKEGTYVPATRGQKRQMQAQLEDLKKKEVKRRKEYDRSIAKRLPTAESHPTKPCRKPRKAFTSSL